MIEVRWHNNHKGNYDHSLLIDIFEDSRFKGKNQEGCIYIVSGEYVTAKEVNKEIKELDWVVLIITSDEQSKFDVENISHENIKIYIQYPKRS